MRRSENYSPVPWEKNLEMENTKAWNDNSIPMKSVNAEDRAPLCPQLGPYFADGQRRVDYVLAYHIQKPGNICRKSPKFGDDNFIRRFLSIRSSRAPLQPKEDPEIPAQEQQTDYHENDKRFRREEFEENLIETGLELEKTDECKIPGIGFLKIHAPWNVLCREAEFMKLKMATNKVFEVKQGSNIVEKIRLFIHKVTSPLHPKVDTNKPKSVKSLLHPFSREKAHLFDLSDRDNFFDSKTRSSIVYELLKRTRCTRALYSLDLQVRSHLRKIKAWKAPGLDGICSRLLRDCADQLSGVVMYLFNLSLNPNKVPALWKTSCVVPVPEVPHPKETTHFRPFSLTSHLMKTMGSSWVTCVHWWERSWTPCSLYYRPGVGVDNAVIYLLHRTHLRLETIGSTGRIIFDFSSAFNTIQLSLFRVKMEKVGADQRLAAWTTDFLTDRPQYVRLHHCESDVVHCSTGVPQGAVHSPFLFTLYTSDFTHDTAHCHIQKFSDDTAIVGYVSEGNDLEYRTAIKDFVSWCELNQLRLNTDKTKEMIVSFGRTAPHLTPVNIQGSDIEVVENYKFPGVRLNNKLDWTDHTHALYKKGQSRLHLLRRLRSFGVCRALLRTFYDSVVASAILCTVVCWGGGSTDLDRGRLNKMVRRASSVLGCPLDFIEVVGERRTLIKLKSIMDNTSHPLHDTVRSLSSSFSSRLLHPWCRKERFRRSFIPSPVRLYNMRGT